MSSDASLWLLFGKDESFPSAADSSKLAMSWSIRLQSVPKQMVIHVNILRKQNMDLLFCAGQNERFKELSQAWIGALITHFGVFPHIAI